MNDLEYLKSLQKTELRLERKLDELPSKEKALEAELEYVRDQIANLECQEEELKNLEEGIKKAPRVLSSTDPAWNTLSQLQDHIKAVEDFGGVDAASRLQILRKREMDLQREAYGRSGGKAYGDAADKEMDKEIIRTLLNPEPAKPEEPGYMTATEIIKRRYMSCWDSYEGLLRVKRKLEEEDTQDIGVLNVLNKRVNELKPDLQDLKQKEKAPLKNNFLESDPNGIGQHDPGSKLDAGKLRAGLTVSDFHRAFKQVMEVVTYGADKYTPSGWLSVPNGEMRYKDAMYRHLIASETEEIDPESGLTHLAHAMWNIMALIEFTTKKSEMLKQEQATGQMNNGIGGLGPA